MKIGQIVTVSIYGTSHQAKIIAIHAAGTIDVQLWTGKFYRVSGLT